MARIRATRSRLTPDERRRPPEDLAANEYRFVDRWRMPATVEEVSEILMEPEALGQWWPAAWLDYESVAPGDVQGLGRVFRYRVKGWLPYSLNLEFTTVEIRRPHGFSVDATGDLVGHGRWTLEQQGPKVEVTYEWRVRADYPLIRFLSPVFKPIFRSNHFWVMRQGGRSMFLEVLRRRATTAEERARIPAPPRPIPPVGLGRRRPKRPG